jgi:hypothetical protein
MWASTVWGFWSLGGCCLLAIVSLLAKKHYPKARKWLTVSAAVLFLLGVLVWAVGHEEQADIVVNNIGVISATNGSVGQQVSPSITNNFAPSSKQENLGDVSLCFVNRQHPVFMAINISDQVVENVKFQAAMFNLNAANPNEPLHMVGRTFDLIRPKAVSGAYAVFTEILDSPPLKEGDRVVGTVGITCPKCVTGRTFWVSLIWGQSGWFAQMNGQTSGGVLIPYAPHGSKAALSADSVAQKAAQLPASDLIPIRTF